MSKKSSALMRKRLIANHAWLRSQPAINDSEASHVVAQCKQIWREMSSKIAPRRYFTTGDIAAYTGLTRRQISKTAKDPNSWLAFFAMQSGKGKHSRFVDPTGWLLEERCVFERVKRSFPAGTRDRWFAAVRIIGLATGDRRRRFLTHREAAQFNPDPEGIFRPLSAPKRRRLPEY